MTAMRARLAILLLAVLSERAVAVRSSWNDVGEAEVRLLAQVGEDRVINGGVEIALEPGWYTYWRNPGDAGIPPSFDFSASENVAEVTVEYPTPERYDDGTSVSNIYRDQVVFPISVTPAVPGQPVALKLDLTFGVCREVCIPATADAELAIPAEPAPDPLTAATLARFAARLPGPPEPGHFAVESVAREGDTITVLVRMPESSHADLFVDAPAGRILGQPTLVSRQGHIARFAIPAAGEADGPGDQLRLVAVAGSRAIEATAPIP